MRYMKDIEKVKCLLDKIVFGKYLKKLKIKIMIIFEKYIYSTWVILHHIELRIC